MESLDVVTRVCGATLQGRYDLVHLHHIGYPYHVIGSVLSNAVKRCPLLVSIHGFSQPYWFRTTWFRGMMKSLLSTVDAYVVPSLFVRDEVLASGVVSRSRDIRVIPHGVDTHLFRPIPTKSGVRERLGSDKFIVMYVGRLAMMKGLDYLVHSIHLLAERPKDIHCVLVGNGQYKDALVRKVTELGLRHILTFLPGTSRGALPDYYNCADVVVLPTLYEAFGMTALEAMACGRPVIATRVGGIPEVVRHGRTGLLVPPRDPSSLAKAISSLHEDEALRSRMGNTARRVVEDSFRLDNMANAYDKSYCELLPQAR